MNEIPNKQSSNIPELDGVRGIAILMVLVWHYVTCQGAAASGHPLCFLVAGTQLFWSGVDLFFVLSGFLIGGILLRQADGERFYQTFYLRRAARILPVYVSLLSCYFLAKLLCDPQRYSWLFNSAIPDWTYLTFTQNIAMGLQGTFGGHFLGVTWSLAVEEQFYLLSPFLLYAFGPRVFRGSTLVLILLAPVLRLLFPGFHCSVNMPFRMDALLMGVALAIIFQSATLSDLVKRNILVVWGAFIVMLVAMVKLTLNNQNSFLTPTFIALFYALFIGMAYLHQGKTLTALIRFKIFTSLGFYSYGLYMYHEAIAGLIHGYFRGEEPTMISREGGYFTLLSFVVTFIVAFISRHTIENFFLQRARKSVTSSAIQSTNIPRPVSTL